MADLIERKDALDCLERGDFDSYEDYSRTFDTIEDIPSVNRWIPVEDALPEIDKDVLVYAVRKDGLGDAVTTITQYINHIWFGHRIDTEPYWRDPWQYFHSDYEITHWMPLPEPPKGEQK